MSVTETPAPKRPAGRKKGPRPKHVPQRMCIICRDHEAKRGLHRIVRSPEGEVAPDPTGRRNGRGAYLCSKPACWEKALASGALARALNVDMTSETLDALRQHAATLHLEPTAANASASASSHTGGES
ncbi:MAG: YlxR family protein [Thermomicrobiales bacterium]